MLKLSACVIVKNEEKNIPTWLTCMKKVANEMIVVDTGSSDATEKLAKEAGAQVYNYKWHNDFSAAKNFALDQATGEWIIFLDADEYFSEETVDNVVSVIKKIDSNQNIDGLLCPLVNIDVDKGNSCISIIQSLRIFRHQPVLRFQGSVHEFLTRSNGPLRVATMIDNIEIHHTGYSSSIIQQKLERNLELLQRDIQKNGEKPVHYPYLADCYYGLKKYEKAVEYAERSIAENVIAIGQESTIYRRLIDSLALAGRTTMEILPAIESAIDRFPLLPEFVWNKGEILFQQKKYVEAEELLKKAVFLEQDKSRKIAGGETFSGQLNLVYCRLGEIAVLKNNISDALDFYVKSLQYYRYNVFVLQNLYQLLQCQDPVEIISLLKTIYHDNKRDLLFLVKALQDYPTSKVYIYYTQQMNVKYPVLQEDISSKALFAAKRYKESIDYIAKELHENYIFMMLSIIYKPKDHKYTESMVFLPKVYCQVLNKHMGQDVILSDDEKNIYNEIEDIMKKIEKADNKIVQTDDVVIEKKRRMFSTLIKNLKEHPSPENEKKFITLFKTELLSATNLYDWIEMEFSTTDKINIYIFVAAIFFENAMEKVALELMLNCYKTYHENEEIVYVFAYMLYLFGDNTGAKKVIRAAKIMTTRLKKLQKLMD